MKDPCIQCDKYDSFLKQNAPQTTTDKNPVDPSLLRRTLQQYQQDQQGHLKYKHLIENAPDAIFVADAETGLIIEANSKTAELLGIPVDQVIGMHQSQLHPPEEVEKYRAIFQKHIQNKSSNIFENIYVQRKDGEKVPVQIIASVTQLGPKKVIYGIFRNIIKQQDLCKQLKASEQQIKAVFESSQDGIVVVDQNYTHLYINQSALDRNNVTPEQGGVGKTTRDGLGHMPDFMNLWIERIDEVFRTGKTMRVQDAISIGDRQVYGDSVLSPIRYPGGEMFAVGIVSRDVTEQKKLQQQLADSERLYKELYHKAKVALFRTRISDGKYLACNMAMAKMFGYDSIEACIENRHSTDCYVDKNRRKELLDKLQKDKQVKNFPVQARDKDGTTMWILITAEIFPEQGYLEGAIADITATKLLTQTEIKILKIILAGKSNKEIAYGLGRSTRTIEDHRSHIMHKLGVDNVVDLTIKALKYGITPDGE